MNDRYAKMKAAFEKQQSNRGMAAIYEGDGHYKHPATQREWENWQDAWQAAIESGNKCQVGGSEAAFEHWYTKGDGKTLTRNFHAEVAEAAQSAWRGALAWQAAAEAAKATGTAPEQCPDPEACNAQGCCNPRGRCEEAHTTGTAGELSESQKIAMQYGQQLNDAEATAFVSGIELGKELEARQPAQVVVMDESWLVQQILLFRGNGRPIDKESAERCARTIMAKFAATNRSQP